jgi:hypothetical protein
MRQMKTRGSSRSTCPISRAERVANASGAAQMPSFKKKKKNAAAACHASCRVCLDVGLVFWSETFRHHLYGQPFCLRTRLSTPSRDRVSADLITQVARDQRLRLPLGFRLSACGSTRQAGATSLRSTTIPTTTSHPTIHQNACSLTFLCQTNPNVFLEVSAQPSSRECHRFGQCWPSAYLHATLPLQTRPETRISFDLTCLVSRPLTPAA